MCMSRVCGPSCRPPTGALTQSQRSATVGTGECWPRVAHAHLRDNDLADPNALGHTANPWPSPCLGLGLGLVGSTSFGRQHHKGWPGPLPRRSSKWCGVGTHGCWPLHGVLEAFACTPLTVLPLGLPRPGQRRLCVLACPRWAHTHTWLASGALLLMSSSAPAHRCSAERRFLSRQQRSCHEIPAPRAPGKAQA